MLYSYDDVTCAMANTKHCSSKFVDYWQSFLLWGYERGEVWQEGTWGCSVTSLIA